MNNLTKEQKKLIYDAVRYYQINAVPLNSKNYQTCNEILNELFSEVKSSYIEPAYEPGN